MAIRFLLILSLIVPVFGFPAKEPQAPLCEKKKFRRFAPRRCSAGHCDKCTSADCPRKHCTRATAAKSR